MTRTGQTFDTGVSDAVAHLSESPEHWSYSALKEIELCPRRYVLGRATYPDLWDGMGYPQDPGLAALFGDVVHDSLDRVIRALVEAGCTSSNSMEGVAVLRKLGGYTKVAEDALDRRLQRLDGNPRVDADRRERLEQQLERRIPEARTEIQGYLQRMTLVPRPSATGSSSARPPRRHPLGQGSHPEASLRADALRIKGRVDLLTVTDQKVDIVDHKTGTQDSAHLDQLRFYALLWDQDDVANAGRTPLGTLTASYPSAEATIPAPSTAQLLALAEATGSRVAKADEEMRAVVPVAVLGEHCGFCSVRGMCDRYWQEWVPAPAELPDGTWFDFEGVVGQQNGPRSWWLLDRDTGTTSMLLRTTPRHVLVAGQHLRLLGIRREVDPEDEAVVALLTSNSETLVVVGDGDY